MEDTHGFIPLQAIKLTEAEQHQQLNDGLALMKKRRSVRDFSTQKVPKEVIEKLLQIASCAPSGANRQPYTFCAISSAKIKRKIREAAEKEEFINYNGRMDEQWLQDLQPLGTDWKKPFLELAPWLIVVFRKAYEFEEGGKHQNYYVQESVGLACGFLIQAIHQVGLVTLTHTPSPMNFLQRILKRPENEKPFLLLPVGYPSEGCMVPDLKKKVLDEFAVWYE
jgi:iodotyrosine deiodinase